MAQNTHLYIVYMSIIYVFTSINCNRFVRSPKFSDYWLSHRMRLSAYTYLRLLNQSIPSPDFHSLLVLWKSQSNARNLRKIGTRSHEWQSQCVLSKMQSEISADASPMPVRYAKIFMRYEIFIMLNIWPFLWLWVIIDIVIQKQYRSCDWWTDMFIRTHLLDYTRQWHVKVGVNKLR